MLEFARSGVSVVAPGAIAINQEKPNDPEQRVAEKLIPCSRASWRRWPREWHS